MRVGASIKTFIGYQYTEYVAFCGGSVDTGILYRHVTTGIYCTYRTGMYTPHFVLREEDKSRDTNVETTSRRGLLISSAYPYPVFVLEPLYDVLRAVINGSTR